jgi:hypothetical protein
MLVEFQTPIRLAPLEILTLAHCNLAHMQKMPQTKLVVRFTREPKPALQVRTSHSVLKMLGLLSRIFKNLQSQSFCWILFYRKLYTVTGCATRSVTAPPNHSIFFLTVRPSPRVWELSESVDESRQRWQRPRVGQGGRCEAATSLGGGLIGRTPMSFSEV